MARMIHTTVGLQLFNISGGFAGGAAGFILADMVKDRPQIPLNRIVIASAFLSIATVASIFIISTSPTE